MCFPLNYYQSVALILVTVVVMSGHTCNQYNQGMHSCLHRYLERDFSTIEDLIHKSPYSQRSGQIVLDQRVLNDLCSNLVELRQCYESYLDKCVSYVNFSHLKRVITTIGAIDEELCTNDKTGIKQLIESGYCIEETRKAIRCNESLIKGKDYLKWPLIVPKMFRFEVGVEACIPLDEFRDCLSSALKVRCEPSVLTFWNNSITLLINQWCNSSKTREPMTLFVISLNILINRISHI